MRRFNLFKHPAVRIVAGIYGILWILTGMLANPAIDRMFDKQFAYGHQNWGSDEVVEIERIEKFHVRNLGDPRNEALIPANGLFRYRSQGIAIAPFLLVDEIGTIFAPLGGEGGIRLNFWFFGCTKSLLVYSY